MSEKTLAERCSELIFQGFLEYNKGFNEITLQAKKHFESQDWYASQRDQAKRIELYEKTVWKNVDSVSALLNTKIKNKSIWNEIKDAFVNEISEFFDAEFTKTYFNSVTRRIFKTQGINPEVEFVALNLNPLQNITKTVPTICYRNEDNLVTLFGNLLADFSFATEYANSENSAKFLTQQIQHQYLLQYPQRNLHHIEMLQPVFYQNTRAFLVGKIVFNDMVVPLAIALKNTDSKIKVDAVVQTPNDFSILFGYTRSYFHVDLETVSDVVVYLQELMPHKNRTIS